MALGAEPIAMRPSTPLADRTGRALRLVDLDRDRARVLRVFASELRGHDAARRALEQLHAEMGFEPAQTLAQRGLRNPQDLRCAAQAAMVDQRHHVAQLLELHDITMSYRTGTRR